eukprot:SM000146S00976  [mRNA]  locus=s146:293691:296418:+ [translate_table: standard]
MVSAMPTPSPGHDILAYADSPVAHASRSARLLGAVALVGARARSLLKQVPLLERAGIGAIAGGIAGGFTNAALHPIDTVKTKLQMRGSSTLYAGPVDVVRKVLAKQGMAGFYCGLPAAVLGSVVSSSIYFGTYEFGKGLLALTPRCPPPLVPPFAAAVGNITSSAVLVPKEVIKQRMQAGAQGTAREVFLSTVRNEGVGGLYAGYSAALLRNLPTNMINFSTFEYLKSLWLSRSGRAALEPWQSMLSGGIAGALSAGLTTPLDVVKTRLMTQARSSVAAGGVSGTQLEAAARAQAIAAYTYKGVASTLQRVWIEEGLHGVTRGMMPRLLYNAAFSSVGFLSFETLRVFLMQIHLRQQQQAAAHREPLGVAEEPAPRHRVPQHQEVAAHQHAGLLDELDLIRARGQSGVQGLAAEHEQGRELSVPRDGYRL